MRKLCESWAKRAEAQRVRPRDKVSLYNSSMRACLDSFGYELRKAESTG
jgi:hypothetical protein